MTRTDSRSRLPRLALTLVALASFAAVSPAIVAGQSPVPSEAPAMRVAPCEAPDPSEVATCLAEATPIEANPELENPAPVPFDHVTVGPDGRTLTVYFWMGAEPCSGLYGVETEAVEGGIALTILVGAPSDVASMTCIAIAELRSTVVTLDQPLVVDGSAEA